MFGPYYFGEVYSTSIAKRLRGHVLDIIAENSTYTRLTEAYMKGNGCVPFDEDVKRNTRDLRGCMGADSEYFRSRILYLNKRGFFADRDRAVPIAGTTPSV